MSISPPVCKICGVEIPLDTIHVFALRNGNVVPMHLSCFDDVSYEVLCHFQWPPDYEQEDSYRLFSRALSIAVGMLPPPTSSGTRNEK